MRIYLTHCSAKKDESFKNTCREVTPDQLYTATPLQRFINRSKQKRVNWAIFSDKYGIWFPYEKRKWYEKHPNKVTEQELKDLTVDFVKKLIDYDEIFFYYNPGRFHSLYKRLLKRVRQKLNVVLFSHLDEIV